MDFEDSNNVSTTLPSNNIFEQFGPHILEGWTPIHDDDELKTESLIGFEIITESFSDDEGTTYVTPHLNTLSDNLGGVIIVFKGLYEDKESFESAQPHLFNGIAYYDVSLESQLLDDGDDVSLPTGSRVYFDGQYYPLDVNSVMYGASFGGEFGAGLFPLTTVKWKDITTKMVYKGVFATRASFEDQHVLTSGLAYYNKSERQGFVYYNTLYYTFDELGITYKEEYEDDFDSFPRRTDAWNAILEAGKYREKSGWPPPLDDVMSQFLYSISIDPTPSKVRSIVIRFDVRILTETPDAGDPSATPPVPAGPSVFDIAYRQDVYTYNKTLNNTLNQTISTALESFFAQFPEMDYSTGEIEKK